MFLKLTVISSSHMGEGIRLINLDNVEDIRPMESGAHLSYESGAWEEVSESFCDIAEMIGAGSVEKLEQERIIEDRNWKRVREVYE